MCIRDSSYTAKSNRPSFFQLRSTLSYNNRFIYEGGNPLLTPETNHDLQFSLIKTRGYRVGPFEIENVLMKHPAVLECAVIGVPDDSLSLIHILLSSNNVCILSPCL